MSIQGVQPKVSAVLKVSKGSFQLVDKKGKYILKPQHQHYHLLPENEDLTMHLAKLVGIETPVHGLIEAEGGELCYFIKRYDRINNNAKRAVEDFAQLSEKSRDTKYNSSIEQVVQVVDSFATFPLVEKWKLFDRVIFNFLVGNEDMHLKNYSLMRFGAKIQLAPAYDFLNTTIVLRNPKEETALPLKGKKTNLSKKNLLLYLPIERMGLRAANVDKSIARFQRVLPVWQDQISRSFLSADFKEAYWQLVQSRWQRLC